MPLSQIDFGRGIVPLTGNDAFFQDTNMIVSYFYEKDPKHLASFCFISYLIKNDVVLCVSEIIITEVINSLARVLYCDDRYTQFLATNSEAHNKTKIIKGFRNDWSSRVLKQEKETLRTYNSLAIDLIKPFIKGALIIEANEDIVEDAMMFASTTPLASADAIIVSTAVNFGCHNIISIDGDMSVVSEIEIISSSVFNEAFDANDMFPKLDISQYLYESLGEPDFKAKFPSVTIPAIAE